MNTYTDLLTSLFFLSFFFTNVYTRDRSDCYANEREPYLRFATKTAYEFVYERPNQRYDHVAHCEPVQIWLLARHGTRFPGKSTIKELHELQKLRTQVINNHEERNEGRLCYSDLDNLKTWVFNVSFAESNLLTKQGKTDLFLLAKRLRTKFPSLFTQGYSQNLFIFRHTDTERTRQSAQIFSEGLFGKEAGVWIPPAAENDTVIRPYDNCTYWYEQVKRNPFQQREVEMFKMSDEMNNVVHNVSRRLGFLYDLSQDAIQKMYDMCRYDKAWDVNGRSPWCAAFAKEELMVMEYLEDMEAYYKAGYGHELNVRLGCTAIKDMLERFALLEQDSSNTGYQPNGVFYFSHSSMITMTLARMGLYKDELTLRHDNYRLHRRRNWRTSVISPFASNIAAVFYKCSQGDYNRVMFYLQEKILEIDNQACEVGLCPWSFVRDHFADAVQHCDLRWCKDGAQHLVASVLLLTLSIFHCLFL